MSERRKHFLINKPLQFRYLAYLTITLIVISSAILVSLYIGIWGNILNTFSDASIRNDLLTATRLAQYEEVRYPTASTGLTALSFFKQTEKLSTRQRAIFKKILDDSNRTLAFQLLLLFFFIGWGSIYISHKIAGPLYRFQVLLQQIRGGNFLGRIHLRKFDEAQDIAQEFNSTAIYLDNLINRLKDIIKTDEKNPALLAAHLKEEIDKIKSSASS